MPVILPHYITKMQFLYNPFVAQINPAPRIQYSTELLSICLFTCIFLISFILCLIWHCEIKYLNVILPTQRIILLQLLGKNKFVSIYFVHSPSAPIYAAMKLHGEEQERDKTEPHNFSVSIWSHQYIII